MLNRYILYVFCFFVLLGCGGSGGSSDSSPASTGGTTATQPADETINGYIGSTQKSTLTQLNSHDVIYHTTIISDLASVLMFGDDSKFLRFDSVIHEYTNTYVECESGSYSLELTNDTSAKVSYEKCISGPYTIDGNGTLDNIKTDTNNNLQSGLLKFDSLSIENRLNDKSYDLSGDINLDFKSGESSTYEALISETGSDIKYWLNNFQVKSTSQFEYETELYISGRIYLSEYGYFDTITKQAGYYSRANREKIALELQIIANNSLSIKILDNENLSVAITKDIDEVVRFYSTIPYQYLIGRQYLQGDNEVPQAKLIAPPSSNDKHISILLDGTDSIDKNYDILSFQWKITSGPQDATYTIDYQGNALAELIVETAGEYTLSMSAFDGESYSEELVSHFYVKQDPPNFSLKDVPEQLNMGTPLVMEIESINPPDDEPIEYVLHNGPEGMSINNNKIKWDGNIPSFGGNVSVNIAIKGQNNDHMTMITKKIEVVDENTQPALILSDNEGNSHWIDINNDLSKEFIVVTRGVIKIYDFSFESPKLILQTLTNAKGNIFRLTYHSPSHQLIYSGYDDDNVYTFDLNTKKEQLKFHYQNFNYHFNAMLVTDWSNDGSLELIVPGKILSLESGEVIIENSEKVTGSDITLADVDGNKTNEIVIGNDIFSGIDYSLLYSTSSSSSNLAVQDIDNDGKAEIISFSSNFDSFTVKGTFSFKIVEVENNQLVETTSDVYTTSSESHALLDQKTNDLYVVTTGEREFSQFAITGTKEFNKVKTHNIEDPTLYFKSSAMSSSGFGCRLVSKDESKLMLKCYRNYERENGWTISTGFYSNVRVDEIEESFVETLLTEKYGFIGNIIQTSSNKLSLGASRSITEVDTSSGEVSSTILPIFNQEGSFLDFTNHSFSNGEAISWKYNTITDQIENFDISGKLKASHNEEANSYKLLSLDDLSINIASYSRTISIFSTDLKLLTSIDTDAPLIHAELIKVNNKYKLIVVTESEILSLLVSSPNKINLEKKLKYSEKYLKHFLVNAFEENGSIKLSIFAHHSYLDNKFTLLEVNLADEGIVEKDVEFNDEYEVDYSSLGASCKPFPQSLISYHYSTSFRKADDEKSYGGSSRVYAINNKTGQISWHSRVFGRPQGKSNLACLNNHRLAFSSPYQFMLSN